MARQSESETLRQLLTLIAGVVIVAALYLGRPVLLPFALAVLLSFLLAPLATRLERVGLWRVPAVLVVALFAFSVLGAVGWLVVDQLTDLIQNLPRYRHVIQQRIETVRDLGGGIFERATDFLAQMQEGILPPPEAPERPERDPEPDPVPVRVVERPGALEIAGWLGPLLAPLTTVGLTLVFTIFLLVQRVEFRDRIIRLAGLGQIEVTTRALSDASRRISRYLIAHVIINVSYGVPVAIGLWIIGLPNALLWGVLATLVRFIPFAGPWIGSLLPIAMSLAVFDDWTRPVAVISMFVVFELFSNNVMEPWLYGSSTGLSMFAVVIAVVFWTWLWGIIGLLLATPLTVCLMVLGKHVDRLAFFDILLSDQPVLDAKSRFYQRLLAGDREDAYRLAESCFEEHRLLKVYDDVVIPALHLAERDRHREHLDEQQQRLIHDTVREIIDRLGQPKVEAEQLELRTDPEQTHWRIVLERAKRLPIVCLPARDVADELTAQMFAQVLIARGLRAHPVSVETLASERLQQVHEREGAMVCITALPPSAVQHARYLYLHLKRDMPEMFAVVALWHYEGDIEELETRLELDARDRVVTSLRGGLRQIRHHLADMLAP